MRALLFTDTLADVNGVARFISDAAREASRTHRALCVMSSTRLRVEPMENVRVFAPSVSFALPTYPLLQIAAPPVREMLRAAEAFAPDVVHVSTPGPVGLLGRWFALRTARPLVGTYHTDFPAYVQRLVGKESLTDVVHGVMSWFYRPFSAVLTRSEEYVPAIKLLGIHEHRIERLLPGIDLSRFGAERRDEGVWARLGCEPCDFRALYVGRVSVEKGLPFLAECWPVVRRTLAARGVRACLTVVGDGPYLDTMRRALNGEGVHFAGFRHGEELATLYASADLFVFPSATDTLGQVVLEAQASGLGVLVTDQGGPRTVIKDGDTGLVLGTGDGAAWIAQITGLALDRARRVAMGRRAAEWALRFSFDRSFDHFWSTHERIARAYHRS